MGIIFNRLKKFFLLKLKNLIKKIKSKDFVNFLFLFLVIFFIIIDSTFYSCSNVKIIIDQKPVLRDLMYKGIKFKAHNVLSDQAAKSSFEAFRHHFFNTANLNFSVSKYFKNEGGILKCFDKNSPFSHPNINFGLFGDGLVNYQLTHRKKLDFVFFSDKDIFLRDKIQYISDLINVYDRNLVLLNLNFNDLSLNNQHLNLNCELILDETKNSLKVQSFYDTNKTNIINKTKKYLS